MEVRVIFQDSGAWKDEQTERSLRSADAAKFLRLLGLLHRAVVSWKSARYTKMENHFRRVKVLGTVALCSSVCVANRFWMNLGKRICGSAGITENYVFLSNVRTFESNVTACSLSLNSKIAAIQSIKPFRHLWIRYHVNDSANDMYTTYLFFQSDYHLPCTINLYILFIYFNSSLKKKT